MLFSTFSAAQSEFKEDQMGATKIPAANTDKTRKVTSSKATASSGSVHLNSGKLSNSLVPRLKVD